MTLRSKLFLLMVFTALLASSLACKLAKGVARPTATPVPVSTQAVQQLSTQVAQAAATAVSGGPLVLELTEEQLTSAAALEMQKQGDMGVSNVQVTLRDNVMKISGDMEQSGLNLPVTIAIQITTSGDGKLQSQVAEATVGPVALPKDLTEQISVQLNQMLLSQVDVHGENYFIDSVTIANGKLTLVAHKR